jgi:hypothetical protein
MGDHRAGTTGSKATMDPAPAAPPQGLAPGGKRAARHAVEQRTSQPYTGRRVARPAPTPDVPAVTPVVPAPAPAPAPVAFGYAGRRVAGRPAVTPPAPRALVPAAATPEDDLDDVSAHLLTSTASPTLKPYVGRRIAPTLPLIAEPEPDVEVALVETPVVVEAPVVVEPVVEKPRPTRAAPRQTRSAGRRAASRRTRVPSLPLLAGVAVLAISAGGALQAVHPGVAGAAEGRISPTSALSGSDALGSSSPLGSRSPSVSRDSDRRTLSAGSASSLQAAANAQAKERDASLSALAGKADKRAAEIKLHQWVLPVTPGVYHLTARFGDYSSLWATFHTGLDFAAPTGTPIMAVAAGTITETAYSGDYGNRTIEQLPDGTVLWYCHQNEFGTAVGDKVKAGQVIGYVGSTGNVTGPHLHLEVHPNGGDAVDPFPVLVAHGLNPGPAE